MALTNDICGVIVIEFWNGGVCLFLNSIEGYDVYLNDTQIGDFSFDDYYEGFVGGFDASYTNPVTPVIEPTEPITYTQFPQDAILTLGTNQLHLVETVVGDWPLTDADVKVIHYKIDDDNNLVDPTIIPFTSFDDLGTEIYAYFELTSANCPTTTTTTTTNTPPIYTTATTTTTTTTPSLSLGFPTPPIYTTSTTTVKFTTQTIPNANIIRPTTTPRLIGTTENPPELVNVIPTYPPTTIRCNKASGCSRLGF